PRDGELGHRGAVLDGLPGTTKVPEGEFRLWTVAGAAPVARSVARNRVTARWVISRGTGISPKCGTCWTQHEQAPCDDCSALWSEPWDGGNAGPAPSSWWSSLWRWLSRHAM